MSTRAHYETAQGFTDTIVDTLIQVHYRIRGVQQAVKKHSSHCHSWY